MLKNLQCNIGQGYFISRPLPENDLLAVLAQKLEYGVWEGLNDLDSIE
ncbi:hypothetical protein RS130_05570 [Paraglaciecola aquimarina]|uniref:EAL domain-containing protein n=1 Tax=Paraglaciecola aquimarina TaxID=1235557 RepID=A0ABU3STX9_9ALTE|nr:hypothetical protein [Paraglaciecola aquimarina]MDU0353464.1 hypothetical protein [Paraglaciecola aquimarina]